MNVHVDLIELAEGGYLCKCPDFPGWRHRQDDTQDLKQRAEASLRMHIASVTRMTWLGWDGRP